MVDPAVASSTGGSTNAGSEHVKTLKGVTGEPDLNGEQVHVKELLADSGKMGSRWSSGAHWSK